MYSQPDTQKPLGVDPLDHQKAGDRHDDETGEAPGSEDESRPQGGITHEFLEVQGQENDAAEQGEITEKIDYIGYGKTAIPKRFQIDHGMGCFSLHPEKDNQAGCSDNSQTDNET